LFRHRDAVLAFGDVERKAFGLAAGIADFLCGLGRSSLTSSSTIRAASRA
jgi:hypothetical protein